MLWLMEKNGEKFPFVDAKVIGLFSPAAQKETQTKYTPVTQAPMSFNLTQSVNTDHLESK